MKVLQTLIIMALLAISSESRAQSNIPQSLTPSSFSGAGYKEYFIRSLQLNSLADSVTLSEIQSRLNQKSIQKKNLETQQGLNSEPVNNNIPADPKNYMNYLDPNGHKIYKLKSSLGLMNY